MGMLTNNFTKESHAGVTAIRHLLVGLSLSCGFLLAATVSAPATAESTGPSPLQALGDRTILSDGVYLYGESDRPDQIGKAYFVFEVKQNQVAGAFYMPSSSFDCAYGQFQADQLALNVVGTYDKVTSAYEIALDRSALIASNSNVPTPEIGLQGFHRLEQVSSNDRRILALCKANLARH